MIKLRLFGNIKEKETEKKRRQGLSYNRLPLNIFDRNLFLIDFLSISLKNYLRDCCIWVIYAIIFSRGIPLFYL